MFVPLLGLYTDSTGLRPVSPRGLVRALGSVVDAVAYGRDVTLVAVEFRECPSFNMRSQLSVLAALLCAHFVLTLSSVGLALAGSPTRVPVEPPVVTPFSLATNRCP